MLVKLIADVHGDLQAVLREASSCDVLLVLGDLINVIDYENAGGILADVYGSDAVRTFSELRRTGRHDEARAHLASLGQGREEDMRAAFLRGIESAHRDFCSSLPDNVVLTFGNVDVPDLIRAHVPPHVRFVDGEVLDLDGTRFGFVGGGLPKVGIPGEVSLDDYAAKVDALGRVDVLCSHVPPAIDDLVHDVRADLREPGSEALLSYIRTHQPSHVYFGHVHYPRVATTQVGTSVLVNVGHHFRSTGCALVHPVLPS
ncbi:MAG TPA: metallophosphoesterase [Actinomycetota bacterium]|nr:metallophosphoesterase [Actinomycetota bacterium]